MMNNLKSVERLVITELFMTRLKEYTVSYLPWYCTKFIFTKVLNLVWVKDSQDNPLSDF